MTVDEAVAKLMEYQELGYGKVELVDDECIIVEDLAIDEETFDRVYVYN